MTELQRKAKFGTFLSAGYAAFFADIHVSSNPYREQPFRDLWAKGYRDAEREHKRKVPFRSTGYVDPRTFDDRRQKFFKPRPKFIPKNKQAGAQTGRTSSNLPAGSKVTVKHTAWEKDGVNLNRLNNKFNNKFRTKV